MKILAFSDTHLGSRDAYVDDPRGEETAMLTQIIDVAREHQVDLLCHAGDVFHRTKPDPAVLHVWRGFTRLLAAEGIPMIVIEGNGSHGAVMSERSAIELFDDRLLRVSRRPELVTEFAGVTVCTLPAVSVARLVADAGGGDRARITEQAAVLLARIAADLRAECDPSKPAVLLGHWGVSGGSLPTGLPVADLHETILELGDLERQGWDAVLLGHVHVPEIIGLQTGLTISLGSPLCQNFGEESVGHGCWIVEIDHEFAPPSAAFISLPGRRFVTVDVDLTAGTLAELGRVVIGSELDKVEVTGPLPSSASALDMNTRQRPEASGTGLSQPTDGATGGALVSLSSEETPAQGPPRPFLPSDAPVETDSSHLLDETDRIAAALTLGTELQGAVLRIRYRATEAQHRRVDHAAIKRLALDADAHRVYQILPEIVRETRARAVGVTEALAPMSALDAWVESQGLGAAEADGLRALLGAYLETVA